MSQATLSIEELLQWAKSNGTSLDSDVEIYHDHTTGLSFRATRDLPKETPIVSCSYQTSLSYLNAVDAHPYFQTRGSAPFPSEFINGLKADDPNVLSHFFLMQQYLMGDKSFWWHYVRLLPQPNQTESLAIPVLWPEEDQLFLVGTNAEPPIKKRADLWKAEWERGISLLCDGFDDRDAYTFPLYQWSASIFGSRSFRASLTIPRELFRNSSADEVALLLEHINKDRFSVLLPVTDIGNHNGVNEVGWSQDVISGKFTITNNASIQKGSQIFNFYGDKSNSELLVGYGFTLPTAENDTVNLRLTPGPEALQMRRSQSCHVVLNPSQPSQETMFHVRMRSGTDLTPPFSHGLIDMISCMVANGQERKFIEQNPGFCLENNVFDFGNPLCRTYFVALNILHAKLGHEISRIRQSGTVLGHAQNTNQRLALDYRGRQLRVLEAALLPVSELVQNALSYSSCCQHSTYLPQIHDNVEAWSLECAFEWLHTFYPDIHDAVSRFISEDQEEPLPLDWAVLVEDWDNTYWVVWIYTVWLLWARDGDYFLASYPYLSSWLVNMNKTYDKVLEREGGVGILYAESSETGTIDFMISRISQLNQWNRVRESLISQEGSQTSLRNFASFVAHEETIPNSQYAMQHAPQKGNIIRQRLLCLQKTKRTPDKSLDGPWTSFFNKLAFNG